MFGARKRRIEELEHEVDTLNECLGNLRTENRTLRFKTSEYQDALKDQNEYTCDQQFDFMNPSINVFSIERTYNGGKWNTNIGYFINCVSDKDKAVHEWWMVTSRSQHQKLVDEYKNSKGV